MRYIITTLLALFFALQLNAAQIIVPMDKSQTNHLKAYGIAYYALENGVTLEWLLNYRGGSFLMPHLVALENELVIRGVSYEIVAEGQANNIKRNIASPEVNEEVVQLEVAPKIARS